MHFKGYFYLLLICLGCIQKSQAQFQFVSDSQKIGLSFGEGQQNRFPYQNENYRFEHKHLKLAFNQVFYKSAHFELELQIEPVVYWSKHQLLNKYFIQPQHFEDYEALREKFTQERQFNSYAVNFGVLLRHFISQSYSIYALASVGPMYSYAGTERVKNGFTFTDILGLGTSLHFHRFQIDLRLYAKHDSNANLKTPNHGHNSVVVETGVLYRL